MPKPLPDDKRTAILTDIKAGTKGRNQIARDHGVSVGTVTKIAKDSGSTDAFDRSNTEKGARARVIDLAARRAALAEEMIALAEHFAKRTRQPYSYYVSTPQGADRVELDEPPLAEVRQGMTAVGIAVDKHFALIKFDTAADGNDEAVSLLGAVATGLSAAYTKVSGVSPTANIDKAFPDE